MSGLKANTNKKKVDLSGTNGDLGYMNYLTPKNLAERYQISERQVTHLARIGYLPGFKIGKLWRFRADDIEAWEKRQIGTDEIAKLADEIIGNSLDPI